MSTAHSKVTPLKQPEAGTVHWLNECVKQSQIGVFSAMTVLAPGLAGELLRRNPDNRGLRETKIEQYAADMRAGNWHFNGEPFIISLDGLLNDGQHRAHAVVNANTPIPALFVFGVPRETRTTIDQGACRSAGDYLSMSGVTNATVRASMARQLIAYRRNEGTSLIGANYVTNADILARVAADHDLAKSATFAASHSKAARNFAAPAVIGTAHYILSEISPLEADDYLNAVCTGEGLSRRDPAYTVRERLISIGKVGLSAKLQVIFRGWNAYRQRRPLAMAKVLGSNLPALV